MHMHYDQHPVYRYFSPLYAVYESTVEKKAKVAGKLGHSIGGDQRIEGAIEHLKEEFKYRCV